ncbi:hypothetical protein BCR41DRAFT_361479 [Lobosporangium transversale]|uniref:Uncharacterized protein n=1 Tax=Lobosporangium transversale TaxID=64571 RepID=A0A1Y2GCV6_9FUNG|nr:hypothetical protein BCR41DRAFT_361479 [Lobosporangium transversale]ORZ05959.1 hypothetical protein BCR41DRAFT_361479 [Lobosporangium transversale]|eukprot:XP_021877340.1 hypothetical protein BCR41DRAFT_361479 [Lobosporangium transversale]
MAIYYEKSPVLDNGTCVPPTEDPLADQIPWEARFPGFATCRIENYVDLHEELGFVSARILSIEGQFHTTGWIPIIYSSIEGAERHRTIATTFLRFAPVVFEAADYLWRRLKDMLQKRYFKADLSLGHSDPSDDSNWLLLSMHVRRGDFITDKHGWQEFDTEWMISCVKDAVESVFTDVTDENINKSIDEASRLFYMATDEVSPQIIESFRSLGAVFVKDLMDGYFMERFGHLVVFEDWLGLVEQLICARATRFYGTMSSSFTGGIVNLRFAQDYQSRIRPPFINEKVKERHNNYFFKPGTDRLLTKEQKQLGIP